MSKIMYRTEVNDLTTRSDHFLSNISKIEVRGSLTLGAPLRGGGLLEGVDDIADEYIKN